MAKKNLGLRREAAAFIAIIIIVVGGFFAYYSSVYLQPRHSNPAQNSASTNSQLTSEQTATRNYTFLKVPAVDSQGNGVVTNLTVESTPGFGRTLVNIENLVFFTDTQSSIQTAKNVAEQISGMNTSNVDLIYSINTDAQVIEGPSAGAALTIATIAALENKTLNPGVMITGTINADGTIGQVGGVIAKAEAAKESGAKIFLVPDGQGTQTTYQPQTSCQNENGFTFCQTQYKQVTTSINTTAGIQIVEVSTVQQALKYFLAS